MKNKKERLYEEYLYKINKSIGLDINLFYRDDLEKYVLNKNVNFLVWQKYILKKEHYIEFIDNNELQDLIDKIVLWYELKYPDSNILAEEEGISPISDCFTFEQLKYRLNPNQLKLIECPYRALAYVVIDDVNYKVYVSIPAKDKDGKDFIILADRKTGKVIIKNKSILEKYTSEEFILIDDLYDILIKENIEFNDKDLLNSIKMNNLDKELREKILNLVALKLLYSKNTTPLSGYERAKKFICEFNDNINNLDLATSEIDDIIKKDYASKKVKVKRFDSKKK